MFEELDAFVQKGWLMKHTPRPRRITTKNNISNLSLPGSSHNLQHSQEHTGEVTRHSLIGNVDQKVQLI